MSQQNVEIVRGLYGDFARGVFWNAAPLFAPEVVLKRIGGEFSDAFPGEWRGIEAFTAGQLEYIEAFEDLRVQGEEFFDLGDRVLVLVRHRGKGRESGLPYDREVADLLTLRDGVVVRWEGYWDRTEALEAVGLREADRR